MNFNAPFLLCKQLSLPLHLYEVPFSAPGQSTNLIGHFESTAFTRASSNIAKHFFFNFRYFVKFFMKCNQNCLKSAGNPRDVRRFQVSRYHVYNSSQPIIIENAVKFSLNFFDILFYYL